MKKLILRPAMRYGLRLRAGAAGTVLNVDLPKETLTEREAADRHISTDRRAQSHASIRYPVG